MKRLLLFALLLIPSASFAQFTLSGTVTGSKGKPVSGASVSLDNTLDGGTTDSTGHFRFTTTEKGPQTLVVTSVGYQSGGMPVTMDGNKENLNVSLKANTQTLDNVTVTAGAFEASNDKTKTILTTLDIVTTAGANADVVQALQTLPGTQKQGTQTGLFVRGGDASEAAVIVDGLTAQNAFFSSAPGVATRSRFTPWQFKGVSFSSGGYSVRYGQALSSVLELNTSDLPDKSTVNLGINFAGVYASGTKLWKNSAGGITASYNNLQPFYGLAKTNVDYYKVPNGGTVSGNYAWKPNKDGILKVLVNGQHFNMGIKVPDPYTPGAFVSYGLTSTNYYGNASFRQMFNSKWQLYTAASYSYNQDEIDYNGTPSKNTDDRAQFRLEGKRFFSTHVTLLAGTELQHFDYKQQFDTFGRSFTEDQVAGYLEAEWSPTRKWAFRPGIRYESSKYLNKQSIAPRLSLAYRTGLYSQVGVATGLFYQNPDVNYMLYGFKPDFQLAIHYIANFQWMNDDRTFRVEGYYKDYQNLVLESNTEYDPNTYRFITGTVDNSGHGYAQGAELFWRDKKLIKNLDYWISYSYIKTERFYKNFPSEATPDFISDHNLNLVTKYWIDKWQTQINGTYSYASGRPYYNPNNPDFLTDKTPDYHNLAFTVNYLTHVKKWFTVVYAGVDNVTNHHNIFGYRYSTDGTQRYEQRPALYRSFFLGVNFSLTAFDKDEL